MADYMAARCHMVPKKAKIHCMYGQKHVLCIGTSYRSIHVILYSLIELDLGIKDLQLWLGLDFWWWRYLRLKFLKVCSGFGICGRHGDLRDFLSPILNFKQINHHEAKPCISSTTKFAKVKRQI